MSGPDTTSSNGPTAVRSRALGPDLARGIMLLFIALANTHGFLHPDGVSTIRAMPIASTLADRVVAILETVLVDGRSYPMFAALFGYGMVQIMRRQESQGAQWPAVRRLLRRRGWWLALLGFLHATLLFYGDILAAYGLLAVILVSSLRLTSRKLLRRAAWWMLAGSVVYGLFSIPMPPELVRQVAPWSVEENPFIGMAQRSASLLLSAPVLAVTAGGALLLGVWAAHRRLLEEPERHLPLLRRIVLIGLPVSVLGGLPLALCTSGILSDPSPAIVIPAGVLHALTGFAGGPAYAALIAVWAIRRKDRQGPLVRALQATGQRSLTCYLSQSVIWAVAFAPYFLDLGPHLRLWQSAVLATATWAATVALAAWMQRAGLRGPFEVALRRLTYRS
jgi:uncharacterized membrane protein YeiB